MKQDLPCPSSCRPQSAQAESHGYSQLILADEASETADSERPHERSVNNECDATVPRHRPVGPHKMLLCGLLVLGLLWFFAFIWALYSVHTGNMKYNNKHSIFEWSHPNLIQLKQPLHIGSPGPYFQPHAITCPKPSVIFLADRFRVWRISTEGSRLPVPVDTQCNITGTIADVAARCENGECWPVVLLNEAPPRIFDCSKNETWELWQNPGTAKYLATNSSQNVNQLESLFVSEDKEVIKYSWDTSRKGYAPHWIVSQSSGPKVLGLDVVNNHLLSFQDNGEVVVTYLESGRVCGTWKVPETDHMIGGGCADHQNTFHILVNGRSDRKASGHRLLIQRAEIPKVEHCVITTSS